MDCFATIVPCCGLAVKCGGAGDMPGSPRPLPEGRREEGRCLDTRRQSNRLRAAASAPCRNSFAQGQEDDHGPLPTWPVKDNAMTPRKVNSVLELVGNTPLVRINRLNPVAGVEVLVKLEGLNPGGSVKDRIALRMIEQAEAAGHLTPGKIVLEASSGNTAIGLAMVCAVKGYQLLVTMSESASEERKRILKAYGAQILLTPGYRGTDGAIEEAYRLAREEPGKYVLVDQFNNEANWRTMRHRQGDLGSHRRQGERRRHHDGDHGHLDGQPPAPGIQPRRPRRRRRALQGPQDPRLEEHEGELPPGSSSRTSRARSSASTTIRPMRRPGGWRARRESSSG